MLSSQHTILKIVCVGQNLHAPVFIPMCRREREPLH